MKAKFLKTKKIINVNFISIYNRSKVELEDLYNQSVTNYRENLLYSKSQLPCFSREEYAVKLGETQK